MPPADEPITRDHVAEAVRALTTAGRRASWREVRRHLGKGSPNTILAHLRALDAEATAAQASQDPQTPAAITDLVGSKVWQAALAAARTQVAAEMQELLARLQAEEARCTDLAGLVERLEEQVVEARRQGDAQVEALRTLARAQEETRQRDQAAAAQLDVLATRLDTLHAQAQDHHRSHGEALAATTTLIEDSHQRLSAAQSRLAQDSSAAWAHLGEAGDDRARRLDALLAMQDAAIAQSASQAAARQAADEQLAGALASGLGELGRSIAAGDRTLAACLRQGEAAATASAAAIATLQQSLRQATADQGAGQERLLAALARDASERAAWQEGLEQRLLAAVRATIPPVTGPGALPS
jgi:hypothetical protein